MKRSLFAALLVVGAILRAARAADPPVDVHAVAPAADDAITQASRRMAQRLAPVLAEPCLRDARVGLCVRDLATGRVLFTAGADEPLAPASNEKLVTSAALLTLLGPEHEIFTQFRADRLPDAAGDVGMLYVVGGGDPSLTVEALYGAARALAAAGVRSVAGVIADNSLFEGPARASEWPQRNFEEWYSAPCSALCANFNVVAVHARGTSTGKPGDVWIDPFPSYFELQGGVVTGRGPWGVRSQALAPVTEGAPAQLLTLTGRVLAGRSYRELRAVEDPALFCAHGVVESLNRVGVVVAGPPIRGRASEGSVLLHAQASKPLALLVRDMNKESSNVFAETLLRVLGAELVGRPGTREKGLAVLTEYLASTSARSGTCRLVDGSGLAPENRLTANVITDLLVSVAGDPFTFPEFLVTLPVGGIDGTLRRRLDACAATRLVRAKTGRINDVVALSGLARVDATRDAVFSLLVNDYNCPTWKAQDAVDRVAQALVADTPAAGDCRSRLDLSRVVARFAEPPTPPTGEADVPHADEPGGP